MKTTLIYTFYICVAICSLIANASAAEICFPEGCFYGDSHRIATHGPEIKSFWEEYNTTLESLLTYLHKTKADIAGFTGDMGYVPSNGHYHSVEFVNGIFVQSACNNGSYYGFKVFSCSNGASNHPTCTTCAAGSTMTNGQCTCNNGAIAPTCTSCPSGLSLYNNICMCSNGATNAPSCNQCPSAATMVSGQCTCSNGTTPQSNCTQCPSGKALYQNQCVDSCSLTNVCNQTVDGVLINGVCSAGDLDNINNSCITTFNVSGGSVNPNGSVEFTWKIADLVTNVKQTCGFYDYTTPTPRPIPGLQNLDTSVDNARITNIQTTTRFCLVCQFYNATTNASLGDAIAHQWIRVIRVGEN